MQPIGPLMIEHRLIERMITLIRQDFARIRDNVAVDEEFAFVDPVFIDTAVDFLRTYADRCHHGKEEGILFQALAGKELSAEHRKLMDELIEDHVRARNLTDKLARAKDNYLLAQKGALKELLQYLEELSDFYPRHIEKEDKHFFIPCMAYFSDPEKNELLRKMEEFDRLLIHEKYTNIVACIENRKACRI